MGLYTILKVLLLHIDKDQFRFPDIRKLIVFQHIKVWVSVQVQKGEAGVMPLQNEPHGEA